MPPSPTPPISPARAPSTQISSNTTTTTTTPPTILTTNRHSIAFPLQSSRRGRAVSLSAVQSGPFPGVFNPMSGNQGTGNTNHYNSSHSNHHHNHSGTGSAITTTTTTNASAAGTFITKNNLSSKNSSKSGLSTILLSDKAKPQVLATKKVPPQPVKHSRASSVASIDSKSSLNPLPCSPIPPNRHGFSLASPITPPPSQSPPSQLPLQNASESKGTMQRPVELTPPLPSPVVKKEVINEPVKRVTEAKDQVVHEKSGTLNPKPSSIPSTLHDQNSEMKSKPDVSQALSQNLSTSKQLGTQSSTVNGCVISSSDKSNTKAQPSDNLPARSTQSHTIGCTVAPATSHESNNNKTALPKASANENRRSLIVRAIPPPRLLPPLSPQSPEKATRNDESSHLQSSPSSQIPPDDLDSEDEEFESLVTAKKNQIKADIAAFQRSKELELVVYEKWLRDDLARKKRRKAAIKNGTLTAPLQHKLGYLPGYLPLLDPGNNNSRPTSVPQSQTGSKRDQADTASSQDRKTSGQTAESMAKSKDDIPRVRTPPRAPSPPRTTQTTPPPLSPTAVAANQRMNLPSLSFSAIKALNGGEKQAAPLASSLKSTSSWSSYSGKNSRRNSSLESPRKKKRVVFQLDAEEGGWVKVRPDGEELGRGEGPIPGRRSSTPSPNNIETVSIIKRGTSPQYDARQKEEESDGDQNTSTSSSVIADSEDDGQDEADWEPLSENSDSSPTIPEELRGAPQFSDDSDDDDVFDLDEEIPLDYRANKSNAGNNHIGSNHIELDDTVADLGLPLAPAPPQGPSPSAIFSPRVSSQSAFERAIAQIAGFSQPRSIIGSLSSSVPSNSYSLVFPTFNTRPPPFNRSISSPMVYQGARPIQGPHDSLDSKLLEASKDSKSSGQTATPAIILTSSPEAIPSPGTNHFRRKNVSKYISTESEEDSTVEAASSTANETDNVGGRAIAKPVNRPNDGTEVAQPSPYATSLPITITPRSSVSTLASAAPDDATKKEGTENTSTTASQKEQSHMKKPTPGELDKVQATSDNGPKLETDTAKSEPKNSLKADAPPKSNVSPQLSYALAPLSTPVQRNASDAEPRTKAIVSSSQKTLQSGASNKGAPSTSGPIVQHFVTDNHSSAETSISTPKLQTPTKLTFPSSSTRNSGIFHGHKSGSQYSSAVAAEAAAAAEAEGLDGESIVGGIDGRTGLDPSSSYKGTLAGSLGLKPGSVAKSLEKAGIKPEAMSFGMRMALEEDAASGKK